LLAKKEAEYIAALKAKDDVLKLKEITFTSTLESTKRLARETVASKDRALFAAREAHAAALEAQEDDFQCRLCLKMEEFRLLEEEYGMELAVRDEELVKQSLELNESAIRVRTLEVKLETKASLIKDLKAKVASKDDEIDKLGTRVIKLSDRLLNLDGNDDGKRLRKMASEHKAMVKRMEKEHQAVKTKYHDKCRELDELKLLGTAIQDQPAILWGALKEFYSIDLSNPLI